MTDEKRVEALSKDPLPRRKRPPWWVRVLRTAGLTAAAASLLLAGIAMFFGDRLIFSPSRADKEWERSRLGSLQIEEVSFRAADGANLVSWYSRVTKPRATVLFFHGNAGNLSDRVEMIKALGHLALDVLIVGYHGYGKSEGVPSEHALYQDAEAAYAYLTARRGVSPTRLIVFGESLGGGPAIEIASKHPCAGLVIQSGFTSIRDMAGERIPIFPVHWFLKSKMDSLSKIAKVEAPKLFLATRNDEVVPAAQTRRLHDASTPPRTWVEFDGCGHNDLFWKYRENWSAAIASFVSGIETR